MTGPEHYKAAELLLAEAADMPPGTVTAIRAAVIARAQVHATLATAAGVAMAHVRLMPGRENTDWLKAAAVG